MKKGDKSTIVIADSFSAMTQLRGIVQGGLVLYQWGTSGVEKVGATTGGLIETVKLNARYPSMAEPIDDSCIIEITITSTPPLLNPFHNLLYVVKIDHAQGHKLLFTPLPEQDLHKEGSQT